MRNDFNNSVAKRDLVCEKSCGLPASRRLESAILFEEEKRVGFRFRLGDFLKPLFGWKS